MDQSLFRKESMEHLSSPEELHTYMKVTSPRLWMLLSAILALLVGFVIYASTTVMESSLKAEFRIETAGAGEASYSLVYVQLPVSQAETLRTGMPVRVLGRTGKISEISQSETELVAFVDLGADYLPVPDGTYEGEIVTESTTPLSFLLN